MITYILHENSCATVKKKNSVTEILSGGNIIHDSQEIVSKFNDFFVNIGLDLAKKITPGNPNTSIMDTMPTPNFTSFFIAPCTSNEIQIVVAHLSNSNGIGIDRFSIKSIKSVIEYLAKPLASIFNPLDARSRYTDFAQTSLRHQKSVYRWHGISTPLPEADIPVARYINATGQKPVYRICFLMRTGSEMPES